MKAQKVNCHINPDIRLTGIHWERVMLSIDIEDARSKAEKASSGSDLSFSLARLVFPEENSNSEKDSDERFEGKTVLKGELQQEIPLMPESVENGVYRFVINMAAADGNSFLENGRWRFITRNSATDSSDITLCTVSYDTSWTLADKDKIFPYAKSKYSYNVWFSTYCGDSVNMVPILNSRFMITNPDWKDHYALKDRATMSGKFRCLLKKIKIWMIQKTYNLIERGQKKDGRHVLFMSETKDKISGNLKYIDARIKERGLDKELVVSYNLRRTVGKRTSIKQWYKTMKLLAKQDYIIIDDFAPLFGFLNLSERTKLIQVWHAGEGFKAVGYSRFGKKSAPNPVHSCHRKYDYVITGSNRLVDVYSEVFGLPKDRFLPLGMARLDGFLDVDKVAAKKAEFYAAHPECEGKKLILFAPTFRGTGQKSAFYDYSRLDIDAIYEMCGDEYIWAFKMHPFTHGKPEIPDAYKDRIIDLTKAGDINDLYYVTDIMITDYSSTYFEFSLLGRPILFYTYDRTVYEVHRGVQKSILETAPGKVCDTFDELMTALKNGDYEIEKTLKFREENFGEYDGHAADKVIDQILLSK